MFTKVGRLLAFLELLVHSLLIGWSIKNGNMNCVWVSLFLAVVFGLIHYQNLKARKFCLAQWSFDGRSFCVYIKDVIRTVEVDRPFCVSKTMLAFNRRYSFEKHPFILIWKPGQSAPYEDMNGYGALAKRDALIIPCNDKTLKLLRDELNICDIAVWPKSQVYERITQFKGGQ
ncbi:MAG: hypothetical protein IJ375_03575 [Oscillospiraceae bacterium]|nr:hypothetical protein [Oscillospiraceae bacterium]